MDRMGKFLESWAFCIHSASRLAIYTSHKHIFYRTSDPGDFASTNATGWRVIFFLGGRVYQKVRLLKLYHPPNGKKEWERCVGCNDYGTLGNPLDTGPKVGKGTETCPPNRNENTLRYRRYNSLLVIFIVVLESLSYKIFHVFIIPIIPNRSLYTRFTNIIVYNFNPQSSYILLCSHLELCT